MVIGGDDPTALMVDAASGGCARIVEAWRKITHSCLSHSGRHVHALVGHTADTFCTSWHPSGVVVATANEDNTVKLWDVRFVRRSLPIRVL